jgi:hypothetical protein
MISGWFRIRPVQKVPPFPFSKRGCPVTPEPAHMESPEVRYWFLALYYFAPDRIQYKGVVFKTIPSAGCGFILWSKRMLLSLLPASS